MTGAGIQIRPRDAFGGAGIQPGKFKVEDSSESDSDPVIIGGLILNVGRLILNGGPTLKFGDEDTDTAINLSIRLPLGSG